MAHTEVIIDGKRCPSVTEVVGLLDKSRYLVPWAARHGTLKAKAIAEYVIGSGEDLELRNIPQEWFDENKIKYDDFWKDNEQLSKEAAERGIAFHALVETNLRLQYGFQHKEPEYKPGVVTGNLVEHVKAVEAWCNRVEFIPYGFEGYVESIDYKFGGTFDCLGKVGKDLTLIDFKLTNQISDSYALQLSGYARCWWEETCQEVQEGRIIRPYELLKPAKADETKETAEGFKHSFKGSNIYLEERRYKNLSHYFELFLGLRSLWDFVNKKGKWER